MLLKQLVAPKKGLIGGFVEPVCYIAAVGVGEKIVVGGTAVVFGFEGGFSEQLEVNEQGKP